MSKLYVFPLGQLQANCYLLICDGEALVIDPGGPPQAVLRTIAEQGAVLQTVLLTHTHFDHMLGLPALLKEGVSLVVPADDAQGLTDGGYNLTALWGMGTLPPLTADRLLREGDTVTCGSLTLTTLHTPGHTAGSSCFLGEGMLFSGDTLFDGSYGRVDLPGGDPVAMRRSLCRLNETLPRPLTVYPGHGGAFTF